MKSFLMFVISFAGINGIGFGVDLPSHWGNYSYVDGILYVEQYVDQDKPIDHSVNVKYCESVYRDTPVIVETYKKVLELRVSLAICKMRLEKPCTAGVLHKDCVTLLDTLAIMQEGFDIVLIMHFHMNLVYLNEFFSAEKNLQSIREGIEIAEKSIANANNMLRLLAIIEKSKEKTEEHV